MSRTPLTSRHAIWRDTGFGAAVFALILAACSKAQPDRRIDAWMTCDECSEQQRSQVAALGDGAVLELAAILRSPPPRRLENARRQIVESYQPVPGLTQEEYVTLMLGSYLAKNQIRAAVSLGDIGTPAARSALQSALAEADARNYRPDVVRAISGNIERVTHPGFTGTLGATGVDFGDTVRIHAGTVPWDGNESVVLHGSPFGTEVFLNRFNTPGTDDSLEFVAVGDLGSYALSVTGQGPNEVTQVDTTLKISSMRYTVHTPATAEVITDIGSLPQTRYLVLGLRGGSDTIDYVRVIPAASVSLTATARWPGLGNVHLAWRDCVPGPPPGSAVAGRVVLAPDTPVAGALVRVVGTGLTTTTAPSGAFFIGGIPPAAISGGLVTLEVQRAGYHIRVFRIAAGALGHVLGVNRESDTPATAMSIASSEESFGAGTCRLLQIWTPPGRHQIVQLRFGTAPTTSGVVSPRGILLTPGQQGQLATTVPVTWASSNTVVATVDATGLVTGVAAGSAVIRATLVADPTMQDSALVRVYPPSGSVWIMTAPAGVDTVNRDGPGQLSVMLSAHAIGPTATFVNPFATVEFWARPMGAGVWRRIGQNSAATAVLTDNGVNRFWTYSTMWNPDATTAPFTTPSLTQLDLIAIGISGSGAVSSTPLNALLWVQIP